MALHHPTSTSTRMKRARKQHSKAKRGCLNKSALLLFAVAGLVALGSIVMG